MVIPHLVDGDAAAVMSMLAAFDLRQASLLVPCSSPWSLGPGVSDSGALGLLVLGLSALRGALLPSVPGLIGCSLGSLLPCN